jgi:hypothetical protein
MTNRIRANAKQLAIHAKKVITESQGTTLGFVK